WLLCCGGHFTRMLSPSWMDITWHSMTSAPNPRGGWNVYKAIMPMAKENLRISALNLAFKRIIMRDDWSGVPDLGATPTHLPSLGGQCNSPEFDHNLVHSNGGILLRFRRLRQRLRAPMYALKR